MQRRRNWGFDEKRLMKINEFKIIFVGGIHGVGKSQFSNRASQIFRIPHLSASELITKQRKSPAAINKRVEDVGDNQDALITAIESHSIKDTKFILDGHFCVFDSADIVQTIPIRIFQKLSPAAVIVLLDEVGRIQERLRLRDNGDFQSELLTKLQKTEREHAEFVCGNLKIPIFLALPSEHEAAIQFVTNHLNS